MRRSEKEIPIKYHRRRSIRLRLLGLMVFLTIVPVLILTWIATENSLSSVEKEIINTNIARVSWAGQYLDELILRFDDLFYSLQINQDLMNVIQMADKEESEKDDLKTLNMGSILTSAYYSHSRMIDKLDLYIHSTGQEISVDVERSGHITYPDIRRGKWTPILNSPVSLRLVTDSSSLYAIHSINTFMGRELLGGMAVRIDKEMVNYVMDILKMDESGDVLLINDVGQALVGSSLNVLTEDYLTWINSFPKNSSETKVYRDQNNLVFSKILDRGRLIIVKTLPLEIIGVSARKIIAAGLLTSGILILASLLLSILFSLRISRPIIKLANTMEETSLLDFKHLKVQSRDEIGLLEEGYNTLMQRMKDMVEKEYQSEIDLRNARLNALHAQINPHFLYNTLQLIGGMALARDASEIYQITKAVGDLFRYTTASEGELVPLYKEINHIRNYLIIQEMRFKDRCSVNILVDESIKDIPIPQFTLQPIVENAFEHGLQPKQGAWKITICGLPMKRGVLLVIEDNGMGMNHEVLQTQRDILSKKIIMINTTESHIGLKNVDTRLKLHFGESYGLKLFSNGHGGTKIAIKLPHTAKDAVHGV